jgi:hypothetical protein
MPAIQPARLKKQAADLAEAFDQPAVFIRGLHALLDLYTDHTHRAGQSGEPAPLIGAYKAPPPVMRQVWFELNRMLKTHPQAIYPLCDALWAQSNLDLKLLASQLLSLCPEEKPEPVIERMQTWIGPGLDKRLLDALLEHGLGKIERQAPERVMELVAEWLASAELSLQQAGLRALPMMIQSMGTQSLPGIFRHMSPFTRIAPSRLRPDIVAVLTSLAQASPSETAYFLRQNLSAPENTDTAWLVRQVLSEFPEETRAGLRQAMKTGKR